MKNNSKGLNLCLIGALVSLIALIVYFFVMYRLPVVFVLLIAAIAFGAVAAVAGEKLGKWIGLLPWCNA
ncbi:MAG: hypothetical protein K6G23_01025, partial [Lachnospiraceae bacterium]|nr:hypothetical protein [Lachnospiraceae bacterium]